MGDIIAYRHGLLLGFLFPPADINNVTAVRYSSEKYHKSTDIHFNDILDLKVLSSPTSTNINYTATQFISSTAIWSEYASLNGAIKDESDPALIANADGRLQAFVVAFCDIADKSVICFNLF